MKRGRRRVGRSAVPLLLAVCFGTAGCGAGNAEFAGPPGTDREWAPLPAEMPMPASAPDDPAAYRGARYRMVHQSGGPDAVEIDGRPAPWLQSSAWGYAPAGRGLDGPYFGEQHIFDGRRRMLWFFRLVEPPPPVYNPNPPPEPPMGTTAPPPRPGSTGPAPTPASVPAPSFTPAPVSTEVTRPPDPPRAIIDVLVLPSDAPQGSGVEWGCGPDRVVIVGDDAWRLNRTSGRIERTDADAAACPDDYD